MFNCLKVWHLPCDGEYRPEYLLGMVVDRKFYSPRNYNGEGQEYKVGEVESDIEL